MKKTLLLIQATICATAFYLQQENGPTRYTPVPSKYTSNMDGTIYRRQADEIAATAFKIVKMLPKNYVTDGTVDYTSFIQAAINKYSDVAMPDFPVLIDDSGLVINNNNRIVFGPKSKIILKPSAKSHYSILTIRGVKDVSIYFPVIQGDRNHHLATDGQWGMGLTIQSADNVNIYNPKISECWGDGIYIGQQKNGGTSRNISIYNAMLDYNRRNGLSITSVDGLKLIHPVISNSTGQAPMAGIDIEPNTNDDIINNILMESPVTYYNTRYGIVLSLGKLIGPNQKEINITVNNHINEGAFWGFTLASNKKPMATLPFIGKIEVNNPVWINCAKYGFKPYTEHNYGFSFTLKNPKIIKMYKDKTLHDDVDHMDELKNNLKPLKNVQLQ